MRHVTELGSGQTLLAAQIKQEQTTDRCKNHGHQRKSPAPAQGVGKPATGQLPAHNAQRGTQPDFGQRFEPPLVRHGVTHPGERQRNHRSGEQAGQGPRQHQGVQVVGKSGDQAGHAATQRGVGDDAELAGTVAQRAVKKLRQPVHHGKHPDHLSGLRHTGLKDV